MDDGKGKPVSLVSKRSDREQAEEHSQRTHQVLVENNRRRLVVQRGRYMICTRLFTIHCLDIHCIAIYYVVRVSEIVFFAAVDLLQRR